MEGGGKGGEVKGVLCVVHMTCSIVVDTTGAVRYIFSYT